MNTEKLQAAIQLDSFQSFMDERWARHYESARIFDIMGMTPAAHYEAEHQANRVFRTTAEARKATKWSTPVFATGFLALVPVFFTGVIAGTASHAAGLAPLLAFVLGASVVGVLGYSVVRITDAIGARLVRHAYPVSSVMLTAWNAAREILEGANEENTVPAILAKYQELEAELHVVLSTYSDLVSPVDREQAERDLVEAAVMVEALAFVAKNARNELYSTRRRQYAEVLTA